MSDSGDESDNGDEESDEGSSDNDSDAGVVTAQNMEKRSRVLEKKKQRIEQEEQEEQELLRRQAEEADEDMDVDADEETDGFKLPTAEEREQEAQSGGVDLVVVQRRIRACKRILNRFSKLGEPGR